VGQVFEVAGGEVVDAKDGVALAQQAVCQSKDHFSKALKWRPGIDNSSSAVQKQKAQPVTESS
jgi:hypothetical protein